MSKKKIKEEWEVGCNMCNYEWKSKKTYGLKCPKCGSDSIWVRAYGVSEVPFTRLDIDERVFGGKK